MYGNNNSREKQTSAWPMLTSLMLILVVGLTACAGSSAQTATIAGTQDPNQAEAQVDATMDEMPTSKVMDTAQADGMMEPTQGSTMEGGTHEPMMEATAEPATAGSQTASDEMKSVPDWYSVSLNDVNSGESFTLQGFKGKVVLVETMAIWCSNCLQQQRQVKALHEMLGESEDFVSLALDIDPNENADDLKEFVDRNGFDWSYAVAPVEVSRELGNLYGPQFLNPPSTPMFIVDRHGDVHLLPFGIKDAHTLQEALEPFLAENME